jgi:hypothetical protein
METEYIIFEAGAGKWVFVKDAHTIGYTSNRDAASRYAEKGAARMIVRNLISKGEPGDFEVEPWQQPGEHGNPITVPLVVLHPCIVSMQQQLTNSASFTNNEGQRIYVVRTEYAPTDTFIVENTQTGEVTIIKAET